MGRTGSHRSMTGPWRCPESCRRSHPDRRHQRRPHPRAPPRLRQQARHQTRDPTPHLPSPTRCRWRDPTMDRRPSCCPAASRGRSSSTSRRRRPPGPLHRQHGASQNRSPPTRRGSRRGGLRRCGWRSPPRHVRLSPPPPSVGRPWPSRRHPAASVAVGRGLRRPSRDPLSARPPATLLRLIRPTR